MRRLFIFVLLLNIAYLAWEVSRPVQVDGRSTQPNSSVQELVLLNEVSPSDSDPVQKTADADQELSIAKVSTNTKTSKSPPARPEKELINQPTKECYTYGPFRELDKVTGLRRDIARFVLKSAYRSREEKEQSLYWVYLPSQKDVKAAQQLGKRLISKKIKDYYIITEGPKINGISLGHFKEKDRAQNHVSRLKKLGFRPEIEPVFKTYTIYWVDYEIKVDDEVPNEVLKAYLKPPASRFDRQC